MFGCIVSWSARGWASLVRGVLTTVTALAATGERLAVQGVAVPRAPGAGIQSAPGCHAHNTAAAVGTCHTVQSVNRIKSHCTIRALDMYTGKRPDFNSEIFITSFSSFRLQ